MKLPYYVVDAFADGVFTGNPAGVCPLTTWPDDATLQAIAAENNLSETAFFAPSRGEAAYDLRWFTPTVEVDLCGHATLASAYVLAEICGVATSPLRFASRSGVLGVTRAGDTHWLDFPARPPQPVDDVQPFADALGAMPERVLRYGRDGKALAVFGTQAEVAALDPDHGRVAALPSFGVIATAPGEAHDFVSRYFAAHAGIPEDPVTGSAHAVLTPYWARRLGRDSFTARQISARGGELACTLDGERVHIGGRCSLYLEGRIDVPG
ncbi:phenazine biosynthesis protein PhzF family [Limimonas halophila]|uniref:Phenazine biosynthesis protein PhzF family n=1 Tax=Limimonas halophila TaxID=1082479 RepID=A0A1G7L7A5_9PROT|nr:PhzF family phenazine biosynthesis protein [Limimonas halophila]SDF45323.1 phenazine biosynthesis protein PhzF family [Limimonas halophila]